MRFVVLISLLSLFLCSNVCHNKQKLVCGKNQTCCINHVSGTKYGFCCFEGKDLICCGNEGLACPARTTCNLEKRECTIDQDVINNVLSPIEKLNNSITFQSYVTNHVEILDVADFLIGFDRGLFSLSKTSEDCIINSMKLTRTKIENLVKTASELYKANASDILNFAKDLINFVENILGIQKELIQECDIEAKKEVDGKVRLMNRFIYNQFDLQKCLNHFIENISDEIFAIKEIINGRLSPIQLGEKIGRQIKSIIFYGLDWNEKL